MISPRRAAPRALGRAGTGGAHGSRTGSTLGGKWGSQGIRPGDRGRRAGERRGIVADFGIGLAVSDRGHPGSGHGHGCPDCGGSRAGSAGQRGNPSSRRSCAGPARRVRSHGTAPPRPPTGGVSRSPSVGPSQRDPGGLHYQGHPGCFPHPPPRSISPRHHPECRRHHPGPQSPLRRSHPSAEDRAVTKQLSAVGRTVGIGIVDHVVIGDGRFVSLADNGGLE